MFEEFVFWHMKRLDLSYNSIKFDKILLNQQIQSLKLKKCYFHSTKNFLPYLIFNYKTNLAEFSTSNVCLNNSEGNKLLNKLEICESLKKFQLQDCHLENEENKIVAKIIRKNNDKLKKFNISYNSLYNDGGQNILFELKTLALLENLKLKKCKLGERELFLLSEFLSKAKSIKKIHISRNVLSTNNGNKFLTEVCKHGKSLQVFKLKGCSLGDKEFPLILNIFQKMERIEKINLSQNLFNEENFILLTKVFKRKLKI